MTKKQCSELGTTLGAIILKFVYEKFKDDPSLIIKMKKMIEDGEEFDYLKMIKLFHNINK